MCVSFILKKFHNLSCSHNLLNELQAEVNYVDIFSTSLVLFNVAFQPVLHDCCNKGCGMCYPVWDDAYKTLATNRKE